MNSAPTSKRYHKAGSRALTVGVCALAGWLAGPGAVVASMAVEKGAAQTAAQTSSPSTTVGDAATSTGPVGPAIQLTPQQIYRGMIEAEKRRRALWMPDPVVPKAFAEKWGVHVIGVHLTAGGYWLRFAFRVDDADKAGVLFDNRFKPYLESEQTGVKLAVPSAAKVGALRTTNRQGNIKNGKIYNIMFSNPGSQIKPGQKVAVVAGDFRVEHLTVRGQGDSPLGAQRPVPQDRTPRAANARHDAVATQEQ